AGGGRAPVDLAPASLRTLDEVAEEAAELGLPWWTLSPFGLADELSATSSFEAAPAYRGDTEALLTDLAGWLAEGWRIELVFDGHGTADRALERLRAADLPARAANGVDPLDPQVISVATGCLGAGLISRPLRLAVLTEADLTGQR